VSVPSLTMVPRDATLPHVARPDLPLYSLVSLRHRVTPHREAYVANDHV
jgi:hypothetical protein